VGAAAGVAPEQAEERVMSEQERRNMWTLRLEREYEAIAETVSAVIDDAKVDGACPSMCADWLCTRDVGHPGRHMAQGHVVVAAAWPGTHAPTLADLGDTQVASR
jgi:hypothetical protein